VVASGQVGFLDWVELKADTESSFTDWLTANGYPYSTASADVFSYYVQKGWYFVAFRNQPGGRRQMAERFAGPWPGCLVLPHPGAGRAIAHGKRRQLFRLRVLVANLWHYSR